MVNVVSHLINKWLDGDE